MFDSIVRRIAGARQDPKTLRWYLPISDYDLKEIRAKYWKTAPETIITDEGRGIDTETLEKIESLLNFSQALQAEDEKRQRKLETLMNLAETLIKKQNQ